MTTKMANIASNGTIYQQMVVPAPFHYHETQDTVLSQNVLQTNIVVPKKEIKKRRKSSKEAKISCAPKKGQNTSKNSISFNVGNQNNTRASKNDCARCCSRRKCFRHLSAKACSSANAMSCKTPEQTVLQLKHHMLKLVSGEPSLVCKCDPRTGAMTLDLGKMHKLYLQEHEPQAIHISTGELNSSYKPTVKQWLYRKILLDEFQGVDYHGCKLHLSTLRRTLEEAALTQALTGPLARKKKSKLKAQIENGNAEYNSYVAGDDRGVGGGGGVLPAMHHNAIPTTSTSTHVLHHTSAIHHSTPHYQLPGNQLVGVGSVGCSPTSALHSPLTPYITSQVAPNILFGLGSQQQTPGTLQPNVAGLQALPGGCQTNLSTLQPLPTAAGFPQVVGSPTQQQPLNLQTSQQQQQQSQVSLAHSLATSSAATALPLSLHSPYYVSLSPVLPLHMGAPAQHAGVAPSPPSHHHHHPHHHVPHHPHLSPHHHTHHPHPHAQQFQHNMAPQHSQTLTGAATFNPHAMYQ